MPDATSERANPEEYDVPNPIRYRATGPKVNYAKKAIEDAEEAYRKKAGENANLNGMFWTLDTDEY